MVRDFPGGPVVKTLCSQHRGHGFNPWLGKIPHAQWMSPCLKDLLHLVSRTQLSWFSFYLTGNFSSVSFASSFPSSQPWSVPALISYSAFLSALTLSDLTQFSGRLSNSYTNSRIACESAKPQSGLSHHICLSSIRP